MRIDYRELKQQIRLMDLLTKFGWSDAEIFAVFVVIDDRSICSRDNSFDTNCVSDGVTIGQVSHLDPQLVSPRSEDANILPIHDEAQIQHRNR